MTIHAIYKGGVFRPIVPVDLPDALAKFFRDTMKQELRILPIGTTNYCHDGRSWTRQSCWLSGMPVIDDLEEVAEREDEMLNETELLQRIGFDAVIFGGKPIIRGRRLAVEHVLGMLAAGDSIDDILDAYAWMEREDVQACLVYARRHVGHERIEAFTMDASE